MIETQLALRDQMYPDYCAKVLYANPASARPPKRSDGYKQRGPLGAQVLPAKASVVNDAKASVFLPPPPPPPKASVVPPRPLPPSVEELALPLPKFLPQPVLPPPPPIFPPGLPPQFSYGPLQPIGVKAIYRGYNSIYNYSRGPSCRGYNPFLWP